MFVFLLIIDFLSIHTLILFISRYAKTWVDAFEKIPNLYQERPPLEDFRIWRDERVMDEVHWYGWFIDYWMEVSTSIVVF